MSKGAQKNFAAFALYVGQKWERKPDNFNENYFMETVAKAIIFRAMEQLVPQQPWYESGYRANIVAYAISKVVHDARERERFVDLGVVWRTQRLPRPLEDGLLMAARSAHGVLTSPHRPRRT